MEEKPLLTDTNEVLMYGDRVRFHWVDEDYVYNHDLELNWEGDLEGLYAGPWTKNPKLAVVTVVTQGQYRGKVLYPYIADLRRVDHPEPMYMSVETKKPETHDKEPEKSVRKYDKITLEKMRDNIIEHFGYEQVHKTMVALDWGWWDCGVPDIQTLIIESRRLLDDVIECHLSKGEKTCCIATGGFEAMLNICEEDGIPDLSPKFVVDDWYEGGDYWDEYQADFERRNSKPVSKKPVSKKKKRRRKPSEKLPKAEGIKYGGENPTIYPRIQ